MALDNIEKLLEKYFEATTTETEEELLRSYFSQGDVATHLEQYAPMFNYFSKAKEETFTKQIPLRPKRINYYKWGSVAAALILGVGLYFGKQYQNEKQLQKEQAEYAYRQTRKALNLLAENFNRGAEKVAYLKEFEVTKRKIYKNN